MNPSSLRTAWNRAAHSADKRISHALLAVIARAAIAAIFIQSGRTKVTGLLTIKDGTYQLFRDEYKLRWCRRRSRRTWPPMPSICFRCC